MTLATIRRRLESARGTEIEGVYVRVVPFIPLTRISPPNWLFASGRPNRYNPASVECVYFSEDERTARAEYENRALGRQPVVIYYAQVRLKRVLDLSSANTIKTLGITKNDLFAPWCTSKRPTVTQLLGQAVSKDSIFSAIRYPSIATREAGISGNNIVIFQNCIRRPDSVRILGPTKKPLQKWPKIH